MKPWNHTAGGGLRKPHRQLGGAFGDVPPIRLRVRICAGDIRNGSPLHHGICDSALLGTSPDGGVAGTALVVGIKPGSHLAYVFQIFYRVESDRKSVV